MDDKARELLEKAKSLTEDLDFGKILNSKKKAPTTSNTPANGNGRGEVNGIQEAKKRKPTSFSDLMKQASTVDSKALGLMGGGSREESPNIPGKVREKTRPEKSEVSGITRKSGSTLLSRQKGPFGGSTPHSGMGTNKSPDIGYKRSPVLPFKRGISGTGSFSKRTKVVPGGLVPLNQVKRDRSTIEELQAERAQARAGRELTEQERIEENRKRIQREKEIKRREQLAQGLQPKKTEERQPKKTEERRDFSEKRPPSSSPGITYRSEPDREKRKERRPPHPQPKHQTLDEQLMDADYVQSNYRSIIQSMFGRGNRREYDDFSDDSDMEAGLDDIRREEAKSARIAKKEDELEEKREKQRKNR